jgi:hypothetical protein
LNAQRLHRIANCHGAADRPLRAIERRKEAVTRRAYLAAAEACELRPHDGIVRIKQCMPIPIAHLRGVARRVHDVGE